MSLHFNSLMTHMLIQTIQINLTIISKRFDDVIKMFLK